MSATVLSLHRGGRDPVVQSGQAIRRGDLDGT